MLDFLKISTRSKKQGFVEVYPKFVIKRSSDLMIRGGDFYAIWVEDKKLWSTDEQDAIKLIDDAMNVYADKLRQDSDEPVNVSYLWDSESGMIDRWHKYCQKQMRDNFHALDENLIFSNHETKKDDYASKKLSYPLQEGDCSSYDKIISTLYSPEEREKIEWAIGCIVSGDSKTVQKFLVFYGAPGTGKSTILNIIQMLFDGYYSAFDAKALGSANNAFALEAFKANPLVAIQHDGNLSKIEDNTRLNSIVSHEFMTVNEKFKSTYVSRFNTFLLLGTNDPVKITNAKSGLIRRLIDVNPSGDKLPFKEYNALMKRIPFELGAIADHCLKVYLSDPNRYDDYIPVTMLGASNDFYNFVVDSYPIFKKEDGVTLKAAWEMYKTYCDEAKVPYPFSQRIFKEELKNYFHEYSDRFSLGDGTRVRSYFSGFKSDKFDGVVVSDKKEEPSSHLIEFKEGSSIFDTELKDRPAQYATKDGTPTKKWVNVTTKLSDIDTSKLHYVKVPENHIVIDFDITDRNGNKCFEKNLEEASKWPPTYAELSKSGGGIHLHYIYDGDVSKLSRVYDDHIEVKIFTGNSSLRRKLTKCCNKPIATINSGLPLKGDNKVINFDAIKDEKHLRVLIKKALNKEVHPNTKSNVDFINHILTKTYNDGLKYDVSDMRNAVLVFAANSTHQSDYCLKLVNKMPFKSAEASEPVNNDDEKIIFFDTEVFPNLFLVNWKVEGEGKPVVRMINPTPSEIEDLIKFRLVGFNCRRYDNHMLYGCLIGYSNEQLYKLSQRIVNGDRNAFFGEAYNISYTDVYDFCSKKQSLKKWEIELGIHHQELGLPWDQPVPEERWIEVAEYCDNDVLATEAVFNARRGDFVARQILAKLANGSVNDTTNSLSAKIIFGSNRNPQDQFNYRFMGDVPDDATRTVITRTGVTYNEFGDEYTLFDQQGRPVFPGYTFEGGKSMYRGEEVGEGGYVYAEPGMYSNIALLDVASMHPSSVIAEELFGAVYTQRFEDIKEARVAIKHHDYERAKTMLNGSLVEYVEDLERGETWFTAEDLAQALKIVINSIYGLTAAGFSNPFRDPRNKDNIVAKRGALFMINLKHVVQQQGYTVAHIKTDSIKIPNATPEIIEFVMEYGAQYGYTFEHEATYEKMCLVNESTYIAKYSDEDLNGKHARQWTATGTQFQVPYVFKTLFSKEPIEFEDMCETKQVSTSMYLDMNEELPEGEHNRVFIGRVGLFCPIKPGCGGGELVRENKDKFDSVVGTKGYRWLESDMVKELGKEKDIDKSFYKNLVDKAVKSISEYGDFEWFISNDKE